MNKNKLNQATKLLETIKDHEETSIYNNLEIILLAKSNRLKDAFNLCKKLAKPHKGSASTKKDQTSIKGRLFPKTVGKFDYYFYEFC